MGSNFILVLIATVILMFTPPFLLLHITTNRRKLNAFMTYSNNVLLSKKIISYGSSSIFTPIFNSVRLIKWNLKNLSMNAKK